ncbi:MAG: hypothetical protein ACXABJ_11025 [Candidatus Heimdallarchaeaceae archaeon]
MGKTEQQVFIHKLVYIPLGKFGDMRFHFKCTETATTIVAPPVTMKPSERSIAQQWRMYHHTPHNFQSIEQNVEEVILSWGNRKAKLKLPFHYPNFEFEGYAYFVEHGEIIKKMQKNKNNWEYIPQKFIISLSDHQFNHLYSVLGGKYIEEI